MFTSLKLPYSANNMPSIIERLRKRTLSHRSSASARPIEMPVSTPLASTLLPTSRSEPSLVDRRIVEDLPALLGALEQEIHDPRALKPSRPRKRSGLGSFAITRRAEELTLPSSEKENQETSLGDASPTSSRWKGKGRASGASVSQQNTGTTTTPWSTFGRHRQSRNLPYGGFSHSRRGSHGGRSTIYGASSSNVGGLHTASNLTSTSSVNERTVSSSHASAPSVPHGSRSLERSQTTPTNPSEGSVAIIPSGSPSHTFGGHSPSDVRARSPSSGADRSSSQVQITASMDNMPASLSLLNASNTTSKTVDELRASESEVRNGGDHAGRDPERRLRLTQTDHSLPPLLPHHRVS